MNKHKTGTSEEWLNLHFLKMRGRDILHGAFDVELGIGPAKERAHCDPNIAQSLRRQIARVPAPTAWDVFGSHVDQIGIDVVIRELGDVLVSRKFRPMF